MRNYCSIVWFVNLVSTIRMPTTLIIGIVRCRVKLVHNTIDFINTYNGKADYENYMLYCIVPRNFEQCYNPNRITCLFVLVDSRRWKWPSSIISDAWLQTTNTVLQVCFIYLLVIKFNFFFKIFVQKKICMQILTHLQFVLSLYINSMSG